MKNSPTPTISDPALIGWLFQNPDVGTEFSGQHPVESGEVTDATDIRPATAENLKAELLEAWADMGARPVPDDRREDILTRLTRSLSFSPSTVPMPDTYPIIDDVTAGDLRYLMMKARRP